MSLWNRYVEYLKDNPEGYWFRRKLYGWGWTPATWQGWATIALFLLLLIANAYRIDSASHSASDTLRPFLIHTFLMVLALIAVCYKTGESPRWQWGEGEK
jgi:hypothetical protein